MVYFQHSSILTRYLLLTKSVFPLKRCILQSSCLPKGHLKTTVGRLLPEYAVTKNISFTLRSRFLLVSNNGRKSCFHTSPKRYIHPAAWIILKPIIKIFAILSGRGFRKWWKDLPQDKRNYFFLILKRKSLYIAAAFLSFCGICYVYYEVHIEETPITKRKRFITFSLNQLKGLSNIEYKLAIENFKSFLLPPDSHQAQRVANVAFKLLRCNKDIPEIFEREWTVSIISDPVHNAFVLPNGQIFVFTGMLDICDNDDQLGSVLAHEIAHCILGHGAEQVSFLHFLDLFIVFAIAGIWAFVPSDALALITQWFFHKVLNIFSSYPYNRMLETEADEVGLHLAAKACFDVRESSAFWTKVDMLEKSKSSNEVELNIKWLSTHPTSESRSDHLNTIMEKALHLRSSCGCTPLPNKDPRVDAAAVKKKVEALSKVLRHKQITFIVPSSSPKV